MLRTVKYLSLLVVQFIGALLGVGALFIAFYAVSTPLSEFESAGWRILGMAFACGMMFPFVLQASLIQSYMPLPLSMGVTRRGFFAGAQAAKVMLAGGIGVCLLLIQLAVKWMFGVDALRFFLLRTFPFGSDGNFSNELLIGTINTDLANKLGNLVSRTTGMAEKYFGGKLPVQREDAPEDCELKKMACALRDRYQAEMDKLQLQNGLDEVFKVIDRANKYIDETAPWALGKDENKRERLAAVLYNLLETIRICTTLLLPVMPDTCDKIFAKLGADEACRSWDNANVWGVLPAGAQISKGENLFPRIDVDEALAKLDELQEQQKKAALPAVELEPYVEDEVDFDTFLKSDFRAVKIKNCETVKKSDKLLKFTLDDGSGTDRIILSGIHQYYEPEQLIGKTAIAILNLPPRKMMGIPSCGMLISAVHKEKGEEKLHLMLIDDSVPAGAKLC